MIKKRGEISPLGVVITAVVLVIVAFLLIFIFRNLVGKQAGTIQTEIFSLDDSDGDGVADRFDKCVCDPGPEEFDGCESVQETGKTKQQRYEECYQQNKEDIIKKAGLPYPKPKE